jgi:hypothetical protein
MQNNIFSTVVKTIKATSITAGTAVSIWTPDAGLSNFRFVLMGYALSLSVAGAIIFEDATGATNEFMRTPLMAAGVGQSSPNGLCYMSSTIGNALFLDVTNSGTVSGYIFGVEN